MPLVQPAALTADQARKLDALRDHATRYEVEVVRADGRRALLCYTPRRNVAGICAAIMDRGPELLAYLALADDARFVTPGRGKPLVIRVGDAVVRPTGRTQRDAIMHGELPHFACPHHDRPARTTRRLTAHNPSAPE